jgi:F0F1-type ATP synthase assembly protein I
MKKMFKDDKARKEMNDVLRISAWGFIIVISSFVFMYVGRWIDVSFNTEPAFMLGMLVLGISLGIFRMYRDGVDKTRQSVYKHNKTA